MLFKSTPMKTKLILLLACCCFAQAFPTVSRSMAKRRHIRSSKDFDPFEYANESGTRRSMLRFKETHNLVKAHLKLSERYKSFNTEGYVTEYGALGGSTENDKRTSLTDAAINDDKATSSTTSSASSELFDSKKSKKFIVTTDTTTIEAEAIVTSTKKRCSPGVAQVSEAKSIFVEESVCHKNSETTSTDETPNNFKNIDTMIKDVSNSAPTASNKRSKAPVPKPTEEMIIGLVPPETNPETLNYVDHSFYKSALVWNKGYFENHWMNITNSSDRIVIHPILNNKSLQRAYRGFALQMRLPFDFPYYGHYIQNITVCGNGSVYTGQPNDRRWFAQDQSIAPLMADFNPAQGDGSALVLYEEATRLTIVWENMTLRDGKEKFTFASTLYKNGDIYFAYKDVPIKIQSLNDKKHSFFVGLSDAYFLNKVAPSYVRRRSLHNYSRIPFNAYNIKSGSILKLIALPSCPIYNTCKACTDHETKYGSFKCMWCERLRKCTSGADFFRPYMADCPFTKLCNASDTNESIFHLSFFYRVFNFAM